MRISVRVTMSGFAECSVDEIRCDVWKGYDAEQMIAHLKDVISDLERLNDKV